MKSIVDIYGSNIKIVDSFSKLLKILFIGNIKNDKFNTRNVRECVCHLLLTDYRHFVLSRKNDQRNNVFKESLKIKFKNKI